MAVSLTDTDGNGGRNALESRRIHGVSVVGVDLDDQTRCRHYRGASDVVAIQMACCHRFVACIRCHAAATDHDLTPWCADSFDEKRVLCGACGERMSIRSYIDGPPRCPSCAHDFNPRCERHYPLYFEV
jgi:uncharacterized CHY-type Zn-finger protein